MCEPGVSTGLRTIGRQAVVAGIPETTGCLDCRADVVERAEQETRGGCERIDAGSGVRERTCGSACADAREDPRHRGGCGVAGTEPRCRRLSGSAAIREQPCKAGVAKRVRRCRWGRQTGCISGCAALVRSGCTVRLPDEYMIDPGVAGVKAGANAGSFVVQTKPHRGVRLWGPRVDRAESPAPYDRTRYADPGPRSFVSRRFRGGFDGPGVGLRSLSSS